MTPHDAVTRLYTCYQEREWAGAARTLHPGARLHLPATDERLAGREQIMQFQQGYPEPWGDLAVLRVTGAQDVAAAEIEIAAPDATFRCAAFWTVVDGLLHDGTEYWVTVGGEQADPQRRPG